MIWLITAVFVVLAALALGGRRWAYWAFIAGGMLFFPASVGFHFHPHPCECALNLSLALFSLTNYGHLVRFTIFFLMTIAQMRGVRLRTQLLVATGAVMAMGIYVELAEGFTGEGHCRLRDLVPDLAGAVIGTALLMLWKLRQNHRTETASAGGGQLCAAPDANRSAGIPRAILFRVRLAPVSAEPLTA